MAPPAPYLTQRVGRAELVCLPGEMHWTVEALEAFGGLHAFAAAQPGRVPLRGRGAAYRVRAGARNVVVRHYRRGGLARVLGDRYMRRGPTRPEHELIASVAARERGIPTPRVVAAAVYPSGIFYRADLITEEVPAATDLAALLFGGEPSEDVRRESVRVAAALIGQAARVGILHGDANAMNILIQTPPSGPCAHLIDLDGAQVVDSADAAMLQGAMTARLLRSLRKLQKQANALRADEFSSLEAIVSSSP